MTSRLRTLVRVALLLVAVVAVVGIAGAGLSTVLDRRPHATVTATPEAGQAPQGSSLTRFLLSLYLAFHQSEISQPVDPTSKQVIRFEVTPGETAAVIGPRLEAAGLIRSGSAFAALARYRGVDHMLEVGEYELSPSMTMEQIITELQHGRVRAITVTIPEGWRMEQVAERLAEAGLGSKDEFLELMRRHDYPYPWLEDRPANAPAGLEGFLFPDTYEFPVDAKPIAVVDLMLRNFDRRVTPELRKKLTSQGMTVYEAVTLAAIVEREAVIAQERPTIAGVFLSRLDRGMLLQADPTVSYAKGFDATSNRWWSPMLEEDAKEVDSPYNTFLYPGLTPGPICSPGLASIDAVANPAETTYLYFVSKGDGSHAFAETFEEHLLNMEKYQQ
ncbi:MAG: endolytic transglycosylase MltG [Anaerolineae bacterium]|nr:endolytic transglycosylase MltG [Anaerolineae bacterium]